MTKPEETPLTIISDFLPRMGLVREGWRQTFSFVFSSLFWEIMLRTWLKRSKAERSWWKNILRKIFSFVAKVNWFLALVSAYFYREPEFSLLGLDKEYLYAPADGKVQSIEQIEEHKFLNGPAIQLTIATGITDVHILRAPHSGRIEYIFSEQNFQGWTQYIGLQDNEGRKYLMGLVTPRSSTVRLPKLFGAPGPYSIGLTAGQEIQQNEKIGVVAPGWKTYFTLAISNTDKFELLLRTGQHTQASMSVLGKLEPR